MKTLFRLLILASLLVGCKTAQLPVTEVPIHYQEKIVERIVPVELPADSSSIVALFECDSLSRVILRQLDEEKSRRVQSNFSFTNGQLSYKAVAQPGTANLTAHDSIVYREIPVKVPVPYEVNKLTWLQKVQLRAGQLFLILIVAGLAYLTAKGKLSFLTKPFWFIRRILK